MPLCPFVAAYMQDNPEYNDLLMPGFKLKTKG
jgi:predicted GNAT family acetyltransferase